MCACECVRACVRARACLLTAVQEFAEHPVFPRYSVAVPALMAELVLTLADPLVHSAADRLHHPGVLPAHLPLFIHQTRDVVAHHLRAQSAHVPTA